MGKVKFKQVGFVIANDLEQYLEASSDQGSGLSRVWTCTPEFAHVYSNRSQADQVAKKLADFYPVWVLVLLESKGQFAVEPNKGLNPSWLS